jgi:glutamate-1-semialdehyde 2,1-aminomutase
MWYQLPYPVVVDRAEGPWLWDVDGNRYLDLRSGDWALIHGHGNREIHAAITAQLDRGIQLACPDRELGYRMASLLIERVPSVERVRYFVSGTEANLAAVRLARAYTGRTKLAKTQGSYHGHADHLVTGSSTFAIRPNVAPGVQPSVLDELVEIPFNDPNAAVAILEREAGDLAAVLIEPVQGTSGMIAATREYLLALRRVTERLGIVLIFDEVATFPVAYGGAQAYFGVTPDLTTMSKVIGGGLPLSAVGGRRSVMDLLDPELHGGFAPVMAVSTFGGNQAALAAGIAALELLTPAVHDRLAAIGDRMREGIDQLGLRYEIPMHSSGLGHLVGLHWAPERVVDYETRMRSDMSKIANLHLALMNQGYYQMTVGYFVLNTQIGEPEVDGFLAALERSLHTLELV